MSWAVYLLYNRRMAIQKKFITFALLLTITLTSISSFTQPQNSIPPPLAVFLPRKASLSRPQFGHRRGITMSAGCPATAATLKMEIHLALRSYLLPALSIPRHLPDPSIITIPTTRLTATLMLPFTKAGLEESSQSLIQSVASTSPATQLAIISAKQPSVRVLNSPCSPTDGTFPS